MKHIILFLLLIYSTSASSTVYNVAATGGNYSTIAQVNAATFVAGDQILFNKGETFYGTLIVQSGSVSNPIVYGAYGTGANPIITGFTTVSSWTNLGGSIWESNVLTDGLTDCNIVTINGVNTAMGRTPNSGSYWNVDSYSANTSITSSSLIGATDWSTSGAAEVVIRKQSWDWYRNTINTHVSGTVTYTMQQTTGWTPKNNWGFFIQNDVRTLDIQNEWYYNPITKRISIYSTSQPVNVKATTKEQVLTCDTKNYVTVDGIKFEGGNTAILYSLNSANIIIQNCIVSQFGYYGVSATNTDNSLITACTFTDGNSSAIFQNGTCDAFNVTSNNISASALLIGMAHLYPYMISTYATNSTVQYNNITNIGGGGIYAASSSLIVRNNYIDTFFQILNDGGGIYTEGNRTGLVIDKNIILNGVGYYGATGNILYLVGCIYLDVLSQGITVSNNTCANAYYGIFVSTGSSNSFTGNTCFNTTRSIGFKGGTSLNTMTGNFFVAKTSTQLAAYYFSALDNIPTYWTTSNDNYFARPILNDNYIQTGQPSEYSGGMEYKNLTEWKAFSSIDANSFPTPKPITSESDLVFIYNETSIAITTTASFEGIDVAGVQYGTSIVLQPYTSKVLIRNTVPVIGVKQWVFNGKTWTVGGKNWISN